MIKTSFWQTLKVIFVFCLWGLGLGTIVSMTVVLVLKLMPDTFASASIVAVPIMILYAILSMIPTFNRIVINDNTATIISLLGKRTDYPINETEFSFSSGWYTINYIKFAPKFYIHVNNAKLNKPITYKAFLYDEEQMENIIIEINKVKGIN